MKGCAAGDNKQHRNQHFEAQQFKSQKVGGLFADAEKRWTIFSSIWYLWMELKYFGIPPALRYIFHLCWRAVMYKVYEAHKTLVLWRE